MNHQTASAPSSSHADDAGLLLGAVRGRALHLPYGAQARSRQHAAALARELGSRDTETSMAAYWSLASRAQQWQHMIDKIGWERAQQARFVEVGSGMGLFTLVGRALGLDVTGVELSVDRYQESIRIAQEILLANEASAPLINAPAEALPIASESVDIVASFQTLEHVGDVRAALSEMRRVLRPGGALFAQAPNYASFYEAHYGLVAPLMLGKAAFRRYVGLQGRPRGFLEHLQWLDPASLRATLEEVGFTGVTITRITQPLGTGGALPIEPASLPYRFRRGALGGKAARALALLAEKIGRPNHHPQLQIWAFVP